MTVSTCTLVTPATSRLWRVHALLTVQSLVIVLLSFANLAFETIGIDLYVVALLALLALELWWRRDTQPLLVYYTTAYGLGLIATALYKGVL